MWVPFELGFGYEQNEGIGVLLRETILDLPEFLNEFSVVKFKQSKTTACSSPTSPGSNLSIWRTAT